MARRSKLEAKLKKKESIAIHTYEACALLEEFYKDNEDLTEQDTSSFDKKQAERLCDLLQKEVEKETIRVENVKILLRLMMNISDRSEACSNLLSVDTFVSVMYDLFIRFELFFERITSEQEENPTEARIRDCWEKLFCNYLCTTHSFFERTDAKLSFGDKFIPALVRVISKPKKYDVFVRRHSAENINQLVKHSKENKLVLLNSIALMSTLAESLIEAGDYGLQANITEILFRLTSWNNSTETSLRSIFQCFGDATDKIVVIFNNIKGDDSFVDSIRSFVVEMNEQISEEKRTVYSIKTEKMKMGAYDCFPGWVDFGTRSMSCFITQPGDDIKDIVDFEYTNIRTLRLSYKQRQLVLQLFNEIDGYEEYYDATDDAQIIGIDMSKESLQLIKKTISGLISACREQNKQKEELINQPPIPEIAKPSLNEVVRKVSTSVIPLKTPQTQEVPITKTDTVEVDKRVVEETKPERSSEKKTTSKKKQKKEEQETGSKRKRATSRVTSSKKTEKTKKNCSSKKKVQDSEEKKMDVELPISSKIGDLLEQVVNSPEKSKTPCDGISTIANMDMNEKFSDWGTFLNAPLPDLVSTNSTAVSVFEDSDGTSSSKSPSVERRLFEDPSGIDTTFGGFNLDETFDIQPTPKSKKGTKRKHCDDESDDFSSEVTAMMSTIIKKQQEKKKRKLEIMKKTTLENIKKMIAETKKKRLKERETLASSHKQSVLEIEDSMMNLAKKMKNSYTKFQQEISSQIQKHQELNSKLKQLKENHQEKLSMLKTKDVAECAQLEKKVKSEISQLKKYSEGMHSNTDYSEKEKQLKALMAQLLNI